ncbi:TAXI family TRAP transporter solute-binding subunit [Brevibacillus parabrevis]|uniref:C4-dicarboxylate ABC transporter substrate-binding protein n=1 Tax=Brevibacillus parabrevis TaxID=54914 RepID=A0A4Y3PBH6_BREPA|nr:TAXI family TRAP transporter solute-binding subunit [Brevibacillus parabrevis]MED2256456.1 TAXI family TRAP transporter solute-binding subunit [Brevibacillus parabrevis]RNB96789.1 TAXI family TRAP transporter solute-binding subunit [Brevibacillus parabrevis]GEB30797.1 C4-dicarboxylate ABC transporter substrate-binding protein [Brevibacillus parabrevis]
MRQARAWIAVTAVVVGLALLASAGGCAPKPESAQPVPGEEQALLTIATGGASGPYDVIGGALAKVYQTKLGYHTAVRSSDGSVENVRLLESGKADLAFAMSDVASFALGGLESFQSSGPVARMKSVAGLYLNYVQIVTKKDRDIHSVYDLKGKRVGVGAPNSGVEVNARMILNEHGITYNDLRPEYLSYSEAIEQLKTNAIDAAFVTSGLPNTAVLALQSTDEVQIVPIFPEHIEKLTKRFAFFEKAQLPPGVYQNEKAIPTVAIRNILLVRSDLPNEQVYRLTKAFFENLDALQHAHEAAKQIDRQKAGENLVVPLHPGAALYYAELARAKEPQP